MIYELRTYTFHPGKLSDYRKLNAEVGRKSRGDAYGKFEGGFTTEFGVLNRRWGAPPRPVGSVDSVRVLT